MGVSRFPKGYVVMAYLPGGRIRSVLPTLWVWWLTDDEPSSPWKGDRR